MKALPVATNQLFILKIYPSSSFKNNALITKQLWTQQENEKTQALLQARREGRADLHVCIHEQTFTVYNPILVRQQTDSVTAPHKPDSVFFSDIFP